MSVLRAQPRVHIAALEDAINRCRAASVIDSGSALDLNLMATLYGIMIYHRREEVDLEPGSIALQDALSRWAGVVAEVPADVEASAQR